MTGRSPACPSTSCRRLPVEKGKSSSYEGRGDIAPQLECSTEGQEACPAGQMQIRILHVVWRSVHPLCWPRWWQLAKGLLGWAGVFPLSLWPLTGWKHQHHLPCSDVSRPFALGLLWWRPPALHSRVCPWLINPPHAHVHTHTMKSPLAHQQPPVSLSLTNTHISPQPLVFLWKDEAAFSRDLGREKTAWQSLQDYRAALALCAVNAWIVYQYCF